jgi:sensor domain CHASE-containing protein
MAIPPFFFNSQKPEHNLRLKNHPACSQMKAVQNENFIITGLVDLTVGERIADTVPMLAAKFHPES